MSANQKGLVHSQGRPPNVSVESTSLARSLFETVQPELLAKAQAPTDFEGVLTDTGFRFVKGDYQPAELRRALLDGVPVVAFLKARPYSVLLVGEDEHGFLARAGDQTTRVIPDTLFKTVYNGEALMVLDGPRGDSQRAQEIEEKSTLTDQNNTVLIYEPEVDDWPEEYEAHKKRLKSKLALSQIEAYEVPPHPMIVVFKKPTKKSKKEDVRGMLAGVYAYIYDMQEPMDVVLHELGHLFWATSMLEEEKIAFDEMSTEISQQSEDERSHLFIDPLQYENGEHVFCTLYMYWLKGRMSDNGYMTILQMQCPEGFRAMNAIFERRREANRIEKAWVAAERHIKSWLRHGVNAGELHVGNRVVKAKVSLIANRLPPAVEIPDTLQKTLVKTHKRLRRNFYRIEEGELNGIVLPFRDGKLDLAYIQEKGTGRK